MEGNTRGSVKGKIFYVFFVLLIFAVAFFGGYYLISNIGAEDYDFSKDGYAVFLNSDKNGVDTYSFNSGTTYKYKKIDGEISFVAKEGIASVKDNTIVHYTDSSLLTLKKMVGIDLNDIDSDVVFYYNVFKNTVISYDTGRYKITALNGDVEFQDLLLRIDTDKFLLAGDNVRLALPDNEIVDFGKYAYFEYSAGSVVKIYNDNKFFQTISEDATLVVDGVSINLKSEEISKAGKAYITLTNLVLDKDGNIDLIVNNEKEDAGEKIDSLPDVDNSNVSTPALVENPSSGEDVFEEEEVDETKILKQPTFKVTTLDLSGMTADVAIEIIDDDALITSPITSYIVENSTYTTVAGCVNESTFGDVKIEMFCPYLKPDTEYTLISEGKFTLDEIEYERKFMSKIFRTEALGVEMTQNYVTTSSVVVHFERDDYSRVKSFAVKILKADGTEARPSQTVEFGDDNYNNKTFDYLDANADYTVVMYDIATENGAVVDDGYTVSLPIKTLKAAPSIGELKYEADEHNAQFVLLKPNITDSQQGIVKYRYEIYDAQDVASGPITSFERDNLSNIVVDAPERNHNYIYRLVAIFNDNEKIVEYSRELGTTMSINGVDFPTLDFEVNTNLGPGEHGVTWEQINGSIVVNDSGGAVVDKRFRVVYKNSLGIEKTVTIDARDGDNVNQYILPINVNGLRANDRYAFKVYSKIDLQYNTYELTDEVAIGTVYVDTASPQNFVGNFVEDTEKAWTMPFAMNFYLTSESGQDASFEASTLSALTFTLYEGSTTEGKIVKTRTLYDTNTEDDYTSTLKDQLFYDSENGNYITLDPTFFGMSNTDFVNNTYMVSVDQAYDYTYNTYNKEVAKCSANVPADECSYATYKNEFTILNNQKDIKISEYLPTPDDWNVAINATAITNSHAADVGLAVDDNLEANTTVAYQVVGTYNNVAGKADHAIYHVFVKLADGSVEELTNIPVVDRTKYFDEDGNLQPLTFSVGYGTSEDTYDIDMMRRGNEYYFTYEVFIRDGNGGFIVWPDVLGELDDEGNPVVAKSSIVTPRKQSTIFAMYPYDSGANSATWKYKYTDVDDVLANKSLYASVGTSIPWESAIEQKDTFEKVTFYNLVSGQPYTIYKTEKRIKTGAIATETLSSQYFETAKTTLNLSYKVYTGTNRLTVELIQNNIQDDVADKITAVDVIVRGVADGTEKVLSNKELSNNQVTVDYYDIGEFLNKTIDVNVVVHFDSGATGFGVGNELAAENQLLQVSTNDGSGAYYCLVGDNLRQYTKSLGCMFDNIALNADYTNMSLFTLAGGQKNVDVTLNEMGISYFTSRVVPKKVETETLSGMQCMNTNHDCTIEFDKIVPGISLKKNGVTQITSFLNKVEMMPILYNFTIRDAQGEHKVMGDSEFIYAEINLTTNHQQTITHVRDQQFTVGEMTEKMEANEPLEITDLEPGNDYQLKFFYCKEGNSADPATCNKQYLYDIDAHQIGVGYMFNTLFSVGIDNVSLTLNSTKYDERTLDLSYTLERISGFDRIEYIVYKRINGVWDETPCGPTNANCKVSFATSYPEPSTNSFAPSMAVSMNADHTSGVTWGDVYRVEIIPYGSYTRHDGGTPSVVEIEVGRYSVLKSNPLILPVVSTPTFWLTVKKALNVESSMADPDYITADLTYQDSDHILVNDTYNIRLETLDGTLVCNAGDPTIIEEMRSYRFAFKDVDKWGDLCLLRRGTTYRVKASGYTDPMNLGAGAGNLNYNYVEVSREITLSEVPEVGDMLTRKSSQGSRNIDVLFTNYYNIQNINKVTYSIVNANGKILDSVTKANFSGRYENNMYVFSMYVDSEAFTPGAQYTIVMQFFTRNAQTGEDEPLGSAKNVLYWYGG